MQAPFHSHPVSTQGYAAPSLPYAAPTQPHHYQAPQQQSAPGAPDYPLHAPSGTTAYPQDGYTQASMQPAQSSAGYGGPQASAGFGAPQSFTGYGGQQGSAAYGGPQASAAYGGPQASAAYGGPQASAAYGGPQASAAYGGPQASAAYGGPQASAGHGAPAQAVASAPPQENFNAPYGGTSQYGSGAPAYGYDSKVPSRSTARAPITQAEMLAGMAANPEFCRSTVMRLPQSASLKQKLRIPLGTLLRPLAPTSTKVEDVHFGSVGKVVRCHRCRTYINPFCSWESAGRRWNCNICGFANDCPQHYFCNLDENGYRTDRMERPELCKGSVEFIAPGDYMVRPPQPPAYLFIIDVSAPAITSGLVATVCQGIKSAVTSGRMPGGSRTLIGVITFDSSIHFYKLDSENAHPQMMVVPNLEDVFVPLPDGVFVNLEENRSSVEALLDSLPTMWASQKISESCAGSALKAGWTAVKHVGGKISVFTSSVPTLGEMTLSAHREGGRPAGPERETELLKASKEDYKQFATLMTQAQLSADLYVAPVAVPQGQSQQLPSVDLPTYSQLAQYTAGEVHYYPNFQAFGSGDKLRQELIHSLTRTSGWEAVMRVRVSRGWKISNWFGHFFFRHNDLLVLPNCHEDQSFGVTLDIEENVAPDAYCYLQSALLYTNSASERRIRVHTLCFPVTQTAPDIIATVDEAAVAALLGNHALELAQKKNLAEARHFLQTSCGQILTTLTQASHDPTAHMLPYYILGLLKSVAFREGRDVSPDLRFSHWLKFSTTPPQYLNSYFYPRMVALHELAADEGLTGADQEIKIPPTLSLSATHMSQNGVYLVEDGDCLMMWIGKMVDPAWLQAVLGVDAVEHLNPEHADALVGATGHQLGVRVAAIINALRQSQLPFMKLFVIRQGISLEHKFFCALIEDRSHALMLSFPEFMQQIGSRPGVPPAVVQDAAAQMARGAERGMLPPASTIPQVPGGQALHGMQRTPPMHQVAAAPPHVGPGMQRSPPQYGQQPGVQRGPMGPMHPGQGVSQPLRSKLGSPGMAAAPHTVSQQAAWTTYPRPPY